MTTIVETKRTFERYARACAAVGTAPMSESDWERAIEFDTFANAIRGHHPLRHGRAIVKRLEFMP